MTAKDLKNALLQEAVQGKLVPPACRQAGKLQAKIPSAKDGQWFVYVIECEDGSFYKGFTTDLQKRYEQHCNGTGADWTKTHKPKQLYYWEIHYSEESALQREKYLKSGVGREWFKNEVVDKPENLSSARDLLEKIRKEKAKLVKEGKLKKEKPLPEITEEDIPFDIPENWCWCRLGELGDFVRGSGIKRDETTNTGLPCVRYGEMYTTYKIKFSKTKSFTSKDVFEKCHKIHTNDILMALTGENKWDIALAATYEGTEELAMGGDLCKFTPINCNSLFLVYLINSPYGIEYKRNTSTGDIIVHTSTTKLGNLLIPLPPLAEQKRIVAALEKFIPLIEEYGKKETELKAFNEQIGTLTKKAILQEAVQGKLVPQIAAEGNAKDLLQEIKKEKVKVAGKASSTSFASKTRAKEFPPITDDEIPFDIPENWCWCRLGEIVQLTSGQDLQREMYNSLQKGIPYITGASNFDNGQILINRWTETPKSIAIKDDLLLTCKGTVGEMAFLKEKKVHIARQVMSIRSSEKISLGYVKHYLTTQIENLKSKAKSMIPGIARDDVMSSLFPLPPLAEQKRIVAAIEKMLPLCEKLGE